MVLGRMLRRRYARYDELTSDAAFNTGRGGAVVDCDKDNVVGIGVPHETHLDTLPKDEGGRGYSEGGYNSLRPVEEGVKKMNRSSSSSISGSGSTTTTVTISDGTITDVSDTAGATVSMTASDGVERLLMAVTSKERRIPLQNMVVSTTDTNATGSSSDDTDSLSLPIGSSSSNTAVVNTAITANTTTYSSGPILTGVEIDHRRGRPNMKELLTEIFESSSSDVDDELGIFMCGPALLLNSVYNAVERKGCRRRRRRILGSAERGRMLPRCAIYEEGFEV